MLVLLAAVVLQSPPQPEDVSVSLTGPKRTIGTLSAVALRAGEARKGSVIATLPEGIHGYQNPPSDRFEIPISIECPTPGFKFAKVTYPKGGDYTMDGAAKPTKVYEGTFEIPFTLLAAKPSPGAKVQYVSVKFNYQLCSSNNCWPPASRVVKVPVVVLTKGAAL